MQSLLQSFPDQVVDIYFLLLKLLTMMRGLSDSRWSPRVSFALKLVIWVFVITKSFFLMGKYHNSVSFLKSSIRISKHFWCIGFHLKWVFWWVNSLNGSAFWVKFSMKSKFDCIVHKKLMWSFLLVGAVMKLSASILAGSGCILTTLNIMPQNLISLEPNLYFSGFIVSTALLIAQTY